MGECLFVCQKQLSARKQLFMPFPYSKSPTGACAPDSPVLLVLLVGASVETAALGAI